MFFFSNLPINYSKFEPNKNVKCEDIIRILFALSNLPINITSRGRITNYLFVTSRNIIRILFALYKNKVVIDFCPPLSHNLLI